MSEKVDDTITFLNFLKILTDGFTEPNPVNSP